MTSTHCKARVEVHSLTRRDGTGLSPDLARWPTPYCSLGPRPALVAFSGLISVCRPLPVCSEVPGATQPILRIRSSTCCPQSFQQTIRSGPRSSCPEVYRRGPPGGADSGIPSDLPPVTELGLGRICLPLASRRPCLAVTSDTQCMGVDGWHSLRGWGKEDTSSGFRAEQGQSSWAPCSLRGLELP